MTDPATSVAPPVPLPMTRPADRPLDPPDELARLREQRPLSPMSFPDGHVGWLVTSHELVRAVLADSRFSSRHELMHYPFPGGEDIQMGPGGVGNFAALDPPEHTRFRRLLTGKFTVRRMGLLTARIEEIAAEHLDAMAEHGPTVDLVQAYAYPIPALTICELLGVPRADNALFQRQVAKMNERDVPDEEIIATMVALQEYMRELIMAKRRAPTDDLLSDLADTDLSNEELEGIGSFLLAAGLDTTANMLSLGVYALLTNPDQYRALHTDPGIVDSAVEELLRYLTVTDVAVKAALEDVELGGELIKQGDTVTLSINAANRDPARFPDPDVLDLGRRAIGHLAFGHGIHQCLGQQLARIEMRIAYPALAHRFPTLRLAVPPADVPFRDSTVRGVEALPVTWGAE